MISAREKGFYQTIVALHLALVTVIYWLSFAVIFTIHSDFPHFNAYIKYWLVAIVAMVFEALTRPPNLRQIPGRMKRIAWAVSRRQCIWILASITLLLVFSRDRTISRVFFANYSIICLFSLYWGNRHLITWLSQFSSHYFNRLRLRTFIIGPQAWCDQIVPEIQRLEKMLEIVKVQIIDGPTEESVDYSKLIESVAIDLLVLSPRHLPNETVMSLMRQGDRTGYRCWMPLELTRTYGRRFELQKIGGMDVLSPPSEPLENTSNQIIKRFFDLVFSAVVTVLVLPPLCLFVWLLHQRYSPGPLFFTQMRVGKNGVPFMLYKFRSLHPNHGDEARQVSKGDNRVFKGGNFLRKSSIDEMPQFFNVLKGEMSVVGPRPHMDEHDSKFREIFERYGQRRYVKPGLTGLAQVSGCRGEIVRSVELRNRARLDNFYVTHWQFVLDLIIIMRTILGIIMPSKKAY